MADRKSADRAEIKAFKAGINRRGLPKQRGSQLVLVLGFGLTLAGAWLADVGSMVGVVFLVVGLPTLLVAAVWSFRHWDY